GGPAVSRQVDRGDASRSGGGNSRRPLSRRFVLPAVLGPDRDAFAGRATGGFAAGAARADRLHDASRGGRGSRDAGGRSRGMDRAESRGGLSVAGQLSGTGAVR